MVDVNVNINISRLSNLRAWAEVVESSPHSPCCHLRRRDNVARFGCDVAADHVRRHCHVNLRRVAQMQRRWLSVKRGNVLPRNYSVGGKWGPGQGASRGCLVPGSRPSRGFRWAKGWAPGVEVMSYLSGVTPPDRIRRRVVTICSTELMFSAKSQLSLAGQTVDLTFCSDSTR